MDACPAMASRGPGMDACRPPFPPEGGKGGENEFTSEGRSEWLADRCPGLRESLLVRAWMPKRGQLRATQGRGGGLGRNRGRLGAPSH